MLAPALTLLAGGCSHDWDALDFLPSASASSSASQGGSGGGGGEASGGAGGEGDGFVHRWSDSYALGLSEDAVGGEDIAFDSGGELVLAGHFGQDVDLGGGTLDNKGAEDILVAKLDATGGHRWSKSWGDASILQAAQAVAVDGDDNVWVAGFYFGTIALGEPPVPSGAGDVFVLKLDGNGNYLWDGSFGDAEADQVPNDIAVDAEGNAIVVGHFKGSLDFGACDALGPASDREVFVVKLDSAGACQWSRAYGGAGDQDATSVSALDDGSLVVAGSFEGSFSLGSTLTADGRDGFVARLDSATGDVAWARTVGGAGDQALAAVAAGSEIAAVGHSEGDAVVDGRSVPGGGGLDALVTRWSTGGTLARAHSFGDRAPQRALGVALGLDDRLWVTGTFEGTIAASPLVLSAEADDVFLIELDPAGEPLRAARFGDAFAGQQGWRVAAGPDGVMGIAGIFRGAVDFGGGSLAAAAGANQRDLFLAALQ